jgi:hypothetical protein
MCLLTPIRPSGFVLLASSQRLFFARPAQRRPRSADAGWADRDVVGLLEQAAVLFAGDIAIGLQLRANGPATLLLSPQAVRESLWVGHVPILVVARDSA